MLAPRFLLIRFFRGLIFFTFFFYRTGWGRYRIGCIGKYSRKSTCRSVFIVRFTISNRSCTKSSTTNWFSWQCLNKINSSSFRRGSLCKTIKLQGDRKINKKKNYVIINYPLSSNHDDCILELNGQKEPAFFQPSANLLSIFFIYYLYTLSLVFFHRMFNFFFIVHSYIDIQNM